MYQKKNYHQTSGSSFFFIVPTHRWQYASSLHHLLSSESREREPSLRSASHDVFSTTTFFRANLVEKYVIAWSCIFSTIRVNIRAYSL